MSTSDRLGLLGPYELDAEIGRGPTAVVYSGRDPVRDRPVAIRLVHLPMSLSAADRAALEENTLSLAQRASRLSHPGLAAVYDTGRDPATGAAFVVFEHVPGQTLAARLDEGPPFEWREAVVLIRCLAEALQIAHENGIVHQDVRPANIRLLVSGEPKLLDLGVVRPEPAQLTLATITPSFTGPLFLSPEQAIGDPVDAQTDLFSLGSVGYRLLTGRDPFGPPDVFDQLVHQDPPRPSRAAPDLPPGVDQVITHALAKSRKERYSEARAFAEDLDDILAGRWPRNSPAVEPATTRRFLSAGSQGAGRGPEDAFSGEGTALGKARRSGRVFAGVVALILVLGIETWRRQAETPALTPTTLVPDTPRPRPAAQVPTVAADPDLPSLNEPALPAEAATLLLELEHPLKSGRLLVFVDGAKVIEERLAATGGKSVLGVRMRSGRLGRSVEVAPGRRQVRVQVLWEGGDRSETIAVSVKAGATRRLSARLGRLTKNLSLDLR